MLSNSPNFNLLLYSFMNHLVLSFISSFYSLFSTTVSMHSDFLFVECSGSDDWSVPVPFLWYFLLICLTFNGG